MILIFAVSPQPTIARVPHRNLDFQVQFRIPDDGRKVGPITVLPGQILSAVHRTDKKAVFQPFVLCEKITIEFGPDAIETDDGRYFVSRWLPILAFCPAFRVPIPPADVYLEVTDFYHKGVRSNNGCSTETTDAVRTEYSLGSDIYDREFPCDSKNEPECIASLNERADFKDSGKTVEWYMAERICIMQAEFVGTASVWKLHCDSSRMGGGQ